MNRKTVLFSSLVLFAFLGLLLFSCGDSKKDSKTIKIGVILPLSGSLSNYGSSTLNGIQMAIDEINQAGGIGNRTIALDIRDNESNYSKTIEVGSQLAESDVLTILGANSSALTRALGNKAVEKKIPVITPSATNTMLTKDLVYVWRICFNDRDQGTALANFSIDNLKARRVIILREEGTYSQGLDFYYAEQLRDRGGKSEILNYVSGSKTFGSQIDHIKSAKPDLVFLPGYYEDVQIILDEARSAGVKTRFLGGDGWDSIKLLRTASADGSYFSTHFYDDSTNPMAQDFVSQYKAKYNGEPNSMTALGYDAASLMIEALTKTTDLTRDNLKASLDATRNFTGVTGTVNFDPNRDTYKGLVILKITGGKLELAQKVSALAQ